MNIDCNLKKVIRGVDLAAVQGCLAALPKNTPLHIEVLDAMVESVRCMRQNLLLAGYAAKTGVQLTANEQPVYALTPEQMREYIDWTTTIHDKLSGEPDKGVDTDTWVEQNTPKPVSSVWKLAVGIREKIAILWMTNKIVLPPDWLKDADLYLVQCNMLAPKGS